MNSLRTVAKTRGPWVGALWRSPRFCSAITTRSDRIFPNPVTTSEGPLSSSDPRVHFGSGTESKVGSTEVRWPNGMVQTVTEVASVQVLKIEGPTK